MNIFRIQWNIGNKCNFDCAYCPSSLKEGLTPDVSVEAFAKAIENIKSQTAEFDLVDIDLTGGEPTLYESLRQSLSSDLKNIKFSFHSNGTAPISWWQSATPNLKEITLTLHQQVDFEHFSSVASVLNDHCQLKIFVPMSVDSFESQQQKYELLKNKFEVKPQMLYKNFTKGNNEYYDYNDSQWTWYFSETGVNPNNSVDVSTTIEFKRINKTNEYIGHLCWAGHSQIIIDAYGWAFRGWCKAGNALGNVYDGSLVLDRKPQVCPKQLCTNGFDLSAKKSENTWGFS